MADPAQPPTEYGEWTRGNAGRVGRTVTHWVPSLFGPPWPRWTAVVEWEDHPDEQPEPGQPERSERPEFHPGQRVRVVGDETWPEVNGREAVIVTKVRMRAGVSGQWYGLRWAENSNPYLPLGNALVDYCVLVDPHGQPRLEPVEAV